LKPNYINKTKKAAVLVSFGLFLAATASAHVVVKPASVNTGSFQTFTVGVTSEKSVPTVGVRLVIPPGLNFVTPNVKPGWKIETKTESTGKTVTDDNGKQVAEMRTVEIIWSGGSIPAGQRDEFVFSAQAPTSAGSLVWKVYQTYKGGSVVAWDQSPAGNARTPYSVTSVVREMTSKPKSWWENSQVNFTLGTSLFALIISLTILLKTDGKHKA
jgi:uncharacterized protein YcnI